MPVRYLLTNDMKIIFSLQTNKYIGIPKHNEMVNRNKDKICLCSK